MSGEELALDFLAALRGDAQPPSAAAMRGPRLGTVDASYGGTGAARVIFDGESAAGLRSYVVLQPVAVGQRVVLLPVGNTFVILGGADSGEAGSNLPAGTSLEGHWEAAPSGFYLEDGAVKVRADDPALFAAIGTRYNTGGETSLQFRLPDSRGRVGVNQAASGTFATLGASVGAETVAHSHPLSSLGAAQVEAIASFVYMRRVGGFPSWNSTRRSAGTTSDNVTASTVGAPLMGSTDEASPSVVQPSLIITRVIKR